MAGGGWVVDQSDPAGPWCCATSGWPARCWPALLADLEAEVGPLSVMVEALDARTTRRCGATTDPTWRYPDRFEARSRAECLAGDVIKGFARHRRPPRRRPAGGRPPDRAAGAWRRVTQAGLGYIEICPPGVDKATGLAVVADGLGVDPGDVLVFGDMPNDLPMFALGRAGPGWPWPTRTRRSARSPTRSP